MTKSFGRNDLAEENRARAAFDPKSARKAASPSRTPWKNRLGLSQKFSGRQMGALITWPPNLFWNILMVDIDEILADAIRTTWLQVNGPESRPPHHIELAIARRVRAALERKGIIMTPSRPPPEAGALKEAGRSHHARHS